MPTPVAQVPDQKTTAGAVSRNAVPFRRGTLERVDTLPSDTATPGASVQRFERTIEGTGFMYGIVLDVLATAAGNAATVAFTEDGPWSALDSVVLKDVSGELVNLTGYDLYLANLINTQYSNTFWDASNLFLATTGSGASGGSVNFSVRIPVGLNRRDLQAIVGNQDRAQKYLLRNDLAASAAIYSTAPTTIPAFTINKYYEYYGVPLPVSPTGAPQAVLPPGYGLMHFTTGTSSDAVPAASAQVNHYLRRIGNTIRWIALIFRSNSSRVTADGTPPTTIQMKIGNDTQFVETYRYRRLLMYERFGFNMPPGVLVYDAIHDFGNGAGDELGNDYWHTQAITNAQFIVSYPSGWNNTNSSLRILTDDLIYQPPVLGTSVG